MQRRQGGVESLSAGDSADTPSASWLSGNMSGRKVTGLAFRFLRRSSVLGVLVVLLVMLFFVFFLYAAIPENASTRSAFLRGSGRDSSSVATGAYERPEELESAREGEVPDQSPELGKALEADAPDALLQQATPGVELIRGAPRDAQEKYAMQIQAGAGFHCFDKSKSFENFEVVNDDYCDCPDGSDEPGTSACAGIASLALKGFACAWAKGGDVASESSVASMGSLVGPTGIVRLGSVNDNICDCCGGEDEWDSDVKCPNRCQELADVAAKEASKAMEGSKARQAYVKRAASLRSEPRFKDIDGGPDDVYLVASEGCLRFRDGDFDYEVCLFKHVTQRNVKSGESYKLGQKAAWSTTLWENGEQRKDYSKLIMSDGTYCSPAQTGRKSEIQFECAATPSIVQVQEAQICVYNIRMQTPAACHSLEHHNN
eukprot:TRINITY_DN77490_c0_g1_i1.p1 TRINITY_DN77490_c0_g1~~TRINITY_DN77490_c0_g1_i1.p1  ORF type:complete len:430 (-),score=72.77 TRINITY_DN77490_c0_g1_i1:232-1521(-)